MTPRQNLVGSSENLLKALEHVSRVAPLQRPVLVIGERGTGKELIAERLHFLSPRWNQPFLQINCATFTEGLLESELFGHDAGAFTGAARAREGLFERADGGTLFLDELATLPLNVQEKLLRVIEYGQFTRLGGNRVYDVDVRVVAATHADLPAAVESGKFRADLLDRLAFDVVHLPPLRLRDDDVIELAEHFAHKMCRELERAWFPGFGRQALAQLQEYSWPGNVRELRNVVERSVYRNDNPDAVVASLLIDPFQAPWLPMGSPSGNEWAESVDVSDANVTDAQASELSIGVANKPQDLPLDLKQTLAAVEQTYLRKALEQHQFRQKPAAEALGLTYHQLRAALRKYPDVLA